MTALNQISILVIEIKNNDTISYKNHKHFLTEKSSKKSPEKS